MALDWNPAPAFTSDTAFTDPPEATEYQPVDSTLQQGSYLSDAYLGIPGDYFLSDLEMLAPFGSNLAGCSTSESSSERLLALNLNSRAPSVMIPATASSNISSSSPSPSATMPQPSLTPFNSTLLRLQAASLAPELDFGGLDSVAEETDLTSTSQMTKRHRGAGDKPDALSACWNSPLCPEYDGEGTPPNPATCGGGCAPFLFADEPLLDAKIDSFLPTKDTVAAWDSVTQPAEPPRLDLKRRGSDDSEAPSGRSFPTDDPGAAVKDETSSPEEAVDPGDDTKAKSRRRLPHNQVERKYRESLNTQLDSLWRVLPALQQSPRGCNNSDIEDLTAPSKPGKAVVLASATAYIKQMEKDKKQLADENTLLHTRVKALQSLIKCDNCSLMQYFMDLKLHGQTT